MAFENSICDDYATEKLYRSFLFPVVPVVMGGANYKAIAPPHSYIDVNDFNTVEELAQYLVKLSKNKEQYNKYFEWKQNYNCYMYMSYCELCEKLNEPEIPIKTI